MLKENPKVGQTVIGLFNNYWDDTGEHYVLKGEIYEIVGISDVSGNPYYLFNDKHRTYIDECAWYLYDLAENDDPKNPSWFMDKIMEVKNKR